MKCAYFPCRSICILQPQRGKIILPRGNSDVVKMWNFYKEKLGYNEEQVIWFDHDTEDLSMTFEMSLMADAGAVEKLNDIIRYSQPGDACRTLLLFSAREAFTVWVEAMGFRVISDTKEWRNIYGYKDILHTKPFDDESTEPLVQAIAKETGVTIRAPRGYTCTNTAELMRAVELMREKYDDLIYVLIKPVFASDGDGIQFHPLRGSDEPFLAYEFPMGAALLEERLTLDVNSDGTDVSIVTHYYGGTMLGPSCDQLIGSSTSLTAFNGNIFPSLVARPARKQCEAMALAIMKSAKPQGPGGFDFLFQAGEPYLVDVNSGRFNGGMNPKAFHKQFGSRDAAYVSFKHVPRCDIDEMWAILKENGLAFDHPFVMGVENDANAGMFGVFPMVHLPGTFGSYIALAPSREECIALKNKFMACNF